jgi:aspartyl aminopeptidase
MSLKYEKKDIYTNIDEKEKKAADKYSKEYIQFISECKTERLCVTRAKKMLENAGFKNISEIKKLKKGDKVYFVNKEKSIFASIIGKELLDSGLKIIGSHIDSPRLDLKPMPLIEKLGALMLKTQYYGGIKKYQWLSIPLAMYGVIFNEKGEKIEIALGDEDDDFCFTIADLLPHLSKDQLKSNANEFIDPEKMNILFGSNKEKDEKEEGIKANILRILNEKYGIKELDFARSEIEFVPAFKAKYVGLDKSMIGGYGQDDRVCAYATIKAIMDTKDPVKTVIALIVDKEEIGSIGNSSMSSQAFDMFVNMLIKKTDSNIDRLDVYYNSKMLSADVSTCVDPNYDEVSDIKNGNILGCGIALEKYTGSGGKYDASDANAEYISYIMKLFEENNIYYQLGTLGKIGKGGGGTIAYILANKGIDVIDCGTPILAMHSPFEVASKYDVYMTYLAYKAFFQE